MKLKELIEMWDADASKNGTHGFGPDVVRNWASNLISSPIGEWDLDENALQYLMSNGQATEPNVRWLIGELTPGSDGPASYLAESCICPALVPMGHPGLAVAVPHEGMKILCPIFKNARA